MTTPTEDRLAALFADPDAVELRALLDACVETWTHLVGLAEEATDIQFVPARVPRPAEDTTERSKGGHSDPTWRSVSDLRRKEVRQFVLDVLATGKALLARGEHAIDRWSGAA